MNTNSPPPQAGAAGRLNVTLMGRFAVAVDGVEGLAERWPSLLVLNYGVIPAELIARSAAPQ